MAHSALLRALLTQEARALLTRLQRLKPFILHMPRVAAAGVTPEAQWAIERHVHRQRGEVETLVQRFLAWLEGEGRNVTPAEAQKRYAVLRMRFNQMLDQIDIFADALTQRSEHEHGVWLAGLDALAADALTLPGGHMRQPPVVCYLDRGFGAAIRRARTRLPGGSRSPVAIIRVPRERMVGSGIASSLVHEVGHQAAVLLDLINPLRGALRAEGAKAAPNDRRAWTLWERWISEIMADLWAVAKLGAAATHGLMGVLSLPRHFVFRINLDDPHPVPWIRVQLSAALGHALYPHESWTVLREAWQGLYPLSGLDPPSRALVEEMNAAISSFIALLGSFRPARLGGTALLPALRMPERHPARLAALDRGAGRSRTLLRSLPPTHAMAAIGQARLDGSIAPEEESRLIGDLLTSWAVKQNMHLSSRKAIPHRQAVQALN